MNDMFKNSLGSQADIHILRIRAIGLQEFGTRNLWLYIVNYIAFPDKEWFASAAQFATEQEFTRSVEISLCNTTAHTNHAHVLIWIGQPPNGDVRDLEAQARSAGLRRLTESDRDGIWVMTGLGPSSKLWALLRSRPSELIPIWPQETVDEFAADESEWDVDDDGDDDVLSEHDDDYDDLDNCDAFYEDTDGDIDMDDDRDSRQFRRRDQDLNDFRDGYVDIEGNMAAYLDMLSWSNGIPIPQMLSLKFYFLSGFIFIALGFQFYLIVLHSFCFSWRFRGLCSRLNGRY